MCDAHHHDPTPVVGRPARGPRPSRRGFVGGAALAGGLSAWAGAAARWTPAAAAATAEPITMAMHVHASFSEGEASMGSQLQCARDAGVDVVWFTEHDWRMSHTDYRTQVSFDSLAGETQFGQAWVWTPTTSGRPSATSGGIVTSPASPSDPSAVRGALRSTVTASSANSGDSYLWFAQTGNSRQNYSGSLAGTTLQLDVFAMSVGKNAWGELRLQLSNHPASGGRRAGSYVLVYQFGASGKRTARALTGTVPVAVRPNAWTTVTLDPIADIHALWPDLVATDNGLPNLWLGATARRSATADVVFDNLRFVREPVARLSPFDVQRSILSAYAGLYADITALAAQEVSFNPQHLNWFGGDDYLIPYQSDSLANDPDPALTNQQARALAARGGQISINHPFGTEGKASTKPPKTSAIATTYLQYGAYAATILEVGYAQRGGATLADHLDLWDIMSRNGVYLTGTGVNDNHVGLGVDRTSWDEDPNRFTTSVWAPARTQAALLAQLASGRAFTSEVDQPGLSLDLYADGVAMGAVSVRPGLNSRPVTVDGRNLPAGATVTLTQGDVDYAGTGDPTATSVDVAVIGAAELARGPASRALSTRTSSFVRATVADGDGRTVAVSNPIWLLQEKSRTVVPAARRSADSTG